MEEEIRLSWGKDRLFRWRKKKKRKMNLKGTPLKYLEPSVRQLELRVGIGSLVRKIGNKKSKKEEISKEKGGWFTGENNLIDTEAKEAKTRRRGCRLKHISYQKCRWRRGEEKKDWKISSAGVCRVEVKTKKSEAWSHRILDSIVVPDLCNGGLGAKDT